MEFISPTKGRLSFEEVFADIMAYAAESPDDSYRLIVGTDSQIRDGTCFVTALIVHRLGKEAAFSTPAAMKTMCALRQRIFFEASLSLSVASASRRNWRSRGTSSTWRSTWMWAATVPRSLW